MTATLIVGLSVSTWSLFGEKAARQIAVAPQKEQMRLRLEADADRKKAQTEAAKSLEFVQFMKDRLKGVGPGVALERRLRTYSPTRVINFSDTL